MTRAQRNCNPLNIRRVAATTWRGQCSRQTDPAFVQFRSNDWGFRAAGCILRTYARRYRAVCVHDIVSRWAPPAENNTDRYIQAVCLLSGFTPRQPLAENEWPRLLQAMAWQESGHLYALGEVEQGLALCRQASQSTS